LRNQGVRGWLAGLCVLLLAGQPINLALVASSVLDAVPVRGAPLAALLVIRLLVAALGVAAGLALLARRAGAPTLAKGSLVASAITDQLVYSTPYFPNNRTPSDTTIVLVTSLAYHAVWLAYLFRSERVRNTYQ